METPADFVVMLPAGAAVCVGHCECSYVCLDELFDGMPYHKPYKQMAFLQNECASGLS